jgi:myo-inositol 2-dehydrogenase/D-chiro-inositol 1-dehydrogenase
VSRVICDMRRVGSEPVRLGLIGCGRIAQLIHLRVLKALPNVRLVALADADPQRLQEAGAHVPGGVLVSNYQDLLTETDVEAVVICLPTGMHAEAAIAALALGKHVYVEKPIASNLHDAQRVLDAWKRSGAVGRVGFNHRFHPVYLQAKQQLHEGKIGTLVGARSAFCAAARSLPDWKRTRSTGGGVLLDLASHHIDLIPFLFDQEIHEVMATIRSVLSEDDTACLELRLENAFAIQSFYSMTTVEEDRFEIYGEEGKLTVDRYFGTEPQYTLPRRQFGRLDRLGEGLEVLRQTPERFRNALFPPVEPSFRASLQAFVDAARRGDAKSSNLCDGYRALAVVDAAEHSATLNAPVPVTSADVTSEVALEVGAVQHHHS